MSKLPISTDPSSGAPLESSIYQRMRQTIEASIYQRMRQTIEAADRVDDVGEHVDTKAAQAAADAASANVAKAEAAASANSAAGSAQTAEQARDDAVAVTYSGDASLEPTPGQIPVARATGKIDRGWLDQGLDAISAAVLDRTPQEIRAIHIYDTRTDSDGGAWTERCQHTSWYNESIIAGKWVGAFASESAARAAGAQEGDYYQRIANGNFYVLDAVGDSQTNRGAKREFPKVVAIISDNTLLTIYDLTEPGFPMWAVFRQSASFNWHRSSIPATSISAKNSIIVMGFPGGIGTREIRLVEDKILSTRVTGGLSYGLVAQRNADASTVSTATYHVEGIASNTVRGVDMAVLPGAPIDPVTGLPVPTIALATSSGVALIKHDGSVVSSSLTSPAHIVSLDRRALWAQRSDSSAMYSALRPGALGAGFTMTTHGRTSPPDFNVGGAVAGRADRRSQLGRAEAAALRVARPSLVAFGNSPATKIAPTYNAGYLTGDIRRAYLASAEDGSLGPAVDLAVPLDLTDEAVWESVVSSIATSSDTISTGLAGGSLRSHPFRVGQSYRFEITATLLSGGGTLRLINSNGSSGVPNIELNDSGTASGYFKAETTILRLRPSTESVWRIDSLSLIEMLRDVSYLQSGADIEGALTAAPVAAGADLVGYSGWSDTNYLREPYSVDLDFGTGEWSVGAWVKVPESNDIAGVITSREYSSGAYVTLGITSDNYVTATTHDGTTTRTVTSPSAYNLDQWISARADYTEDGTLSLHVNGRQVAETTGSPLLTLNNGDAVLTIGNNYDLDAPFPGSIALLKLGATVPTPEQSAWIYSQEKQIFREGAKCVLPDDGALVDLAYDEQTDTWIAASAANVSEWSGLVRTRVVPTAGGDILKVSGGAGARLLARAGVGVDIDMPGGSLRAELSKQSRTKDRKIATFDRDATAGQTRFALPPGYSVARVSVDGAAKREGSTKDYTLEFDGFIETVVFAVAPGDSAWVRIDAWED